MHVPVAYKDLLCVSNERNYWVPGKQRPLTDPRTVDPLDKILCFIILLLVH